MTKKSVSVIIPVHNEEGNLDHLFDRMQKVASTIELKKEYVFINDGSTDRSQEMLDNFASKNEYVKVISLSRNFG